MVAFLEKWVKVIFVAFLTSMPGIKTTVCTADQNLAHRSVRLATHL